MALTFVLGASGSGKTDYLYNLVLSEAKKNPQSNYYVIVPEQFTLRTQQDLTTRSESGGILNVDVLSFMRLAHKVFLKLGKTGALALNDAGKSMIIKRVLSEHGKELKVYATSAGRAGFVEEAKSLVSELLQYGIGEGELLEMMDKAEGDTLLCSKLQDALVLYKGFMDTLSEGYTTGEEIFDLLADCLLNTDILSDATVVLDGFTGFTPSQYSLLKRIFAGSKDCYVALTVPAEDYLSAPAGHDLFYLTKKSLLKVEALAKEAGVSVNEPVLCEDIKRYGKESKLSHLERNIFRLKRKVMKAGCGGDCIQIKGLPSVNDECLFAVTKTFRLLKEKGYRYKDIAIVCSDLFSYAPVLVKEFEKVGIPAFADIKKSMSDNVLSTYIRALLTIAERGLSLENAMIYIKNPLTSYTEDEACMVENYCIARGISLPFAFERKWERKTKEAATDEEVALLEGIRQRLVAETAAFSDIFKSSENTGEVTDKIKEYLKAVQIEEKTEELAEEFKMQGDFLRAKEYKQICKVLEDVLDQLKGIMGHRKFSVKEYRELVETGLREAKVGLIPQGSEQIVIGDLERTRLNDIKALIMLGINDGKVPANSGGGGILTDAERRKLAEKDVELAPDAVTSAAYSNFYIYQSLSKPREELIITYSSISDDGKAVKPAYLIKRIKGLFEDELEVTSAGEDKEDKIYGILKNDYGESSFIAALRDFAVDIKNENDPDKSGEEAEKAALKGQTFSALLKKYADTLTKEELENVVRLSLGIPKEEKIPEESARLIFDLPAKSSVTRLQLFAECPFKHFLKSGLKIEEREEFKVGTNDIGNVYHGVLEGIAKELREKNETFKDLTDERIKGYVKDFVAKEIDNYSADIFKETERTPFMTGEIEKTLEISLKSIRDQLKDSLFEPGFFEKDFYLKGKNINLVGIVDRIDKYEDEDNLILNFVDYKSGAKKFDLSSFYYGNSIQLPVYMTAQVEEMSSVTKKEVIPGGMYYYHVYNPTADKEKTKGETEEELIKASEEVRIKQMKLNGPTNSDPRVIKALKPEFYDENGELAPSVKSDMVNVSSSSVNKDTGEISLKGKVISEEGFKLIKAHTDYLLEEEGKEIAGGAAEIKPQRFKKRTACDFCDYRNVCGFDRKCGYSYKELKPMTDDEVFEEIKKETGNKETGNKETGNKSVNSGEEGEKNE
ncbi:MAG: PD-(D/E)XK nuclease family protein [Lachnospiraceae bacterium]|nr:PD-(D/E)XK nuclease family protein [Lachnospiraceae bacterium]